MGALQPPTSFRLPAALPCPTPPTPLRRSFNKLRVFSLTQFRKVVWLDGDDYFVQNVDHLLALPAMSGSVVTACCHAVGASPPAARWAPAPPRVWRCG